MGNSEIQASEWDKIPISKIRDTVINQLQLNYAHGNLEAQDFENKLDYATNSEDKTGLINVIKDLPWIENKEDNVQFQPPAVRINKGKVKPTGVLFALLGGAARKGIWQPPHSLKAFSMLGGIDIDLREAEIPPEGVDIDILCVLGGVDIIVPPGLNLDVVGIPVLGGFENKAHEMVNPKAPTVRIRGLALLGGVEIKAKERK